MRKTSLASLLLVVVLAAAAWAGPPPTATGVWLDQSKNYAFSCAAAGSAMQIVTNGKYMVRVMGADVNLVFDTSYDGGTANNRPMPANLAYLESFYAADGGTLLACQSAVDGGAVYLTGTH
jgi:hypothetical protein